MIRGSNNLGFDLSAILDRASCEVLQAVWHCRWWASGPVTARLAFVSNPTYVRLGWVELGLWQLISIKLQISEITKVLKNYRNFPIPSKVNCVKKFYEVSLHIFSTTIYSKICWTFWTLPQLWYDTVILSCVWPIARVPRPDCSIKYIIMEARPGRN